MILEIILLVLIILNLAVVGALALFGKKNLLLLFAVLEAVLAIVFAIITTKGI